ncbi:MAG: hypothetical protein ACD_46C00217G0003 [uncultured bacterium]|nr:MAG: hypothetical protein ACD_46C00217G0003 [uncultured bacterium]
MTLRNHLKPAQNSENRTLFLMLLVLTFFYMLIEVSFFIQSNNAYLFDFSFVSEKIRIPYIIFPDILRFIFTQISLHLFYCLFIWMISILLSSLLSIFAERKFSLSIATWFLGILTALFANQYYFPHSKFADLTRVIIPDLFIYPIYLFFFMICVGVLALTIIALLKKIFNHQYSYSISILLLMFFVAVIIKPNPLPIHDGATVVKPNIIIIGVDSLRPDFLGYFNEDRKTPFLDSLLNQSLVFTESVTPLARTFPSWTSILSGEYPKNIGIRSNLAKQDHVQFENSLPAVLQKNGYETIYATDETRFSNIDHRYAFNQLITPPVGLNDFLLGTFNDFPLSNLLINTKIGQWLFPYSYANRPVYFTYQPNSFLELMRPALNTNRTQPLFLAVHFCLPHHPYIWADYRGDTGNVLAKYAASISKVDEQIKQFFSLLTQTKLLDHAIVIVLSDHGEALELPGDRITEKEFFSNKHTKKLPKFYPPSLDKEEINQSAGHGTDVLGLTQYHTLLAFKLYGLGNYQVGARSGVVSLLDIKPTIFDLLNLSPKKSLKIDGRSLAALINGQQQTIPQQHVFLESDFSPEAIHTVFPDTRKVVLEGIELFEADRKTARLTVKDSMTEMIIRSKQYADIYGEWMLAFYPQNNRYRMPILVNLVTGEWTNDLTSSFAKHSPALQMQKKLKEFYGAELE